MDYGRILARAWEITWRWKVLWILGFLAGLGSGIGGGGNTGYRFSNRDLQANRLPNLNLPSELTGLLVGVACLAFIVGIILWVLSVMARGGLIAAVAQVEETGMTTLGSAWRAGQSRFWTLFGISFLLIVIPLLILIAIAVVGAISVFGIASVSTGLSGNQAAGPGVGAIVAICCLCFAICGLALLLLVLEQVRVYAERAAMLEGLNVTAAASRGWQVLREHFGPTLVLWLIFVVVAIVIGVIAAIIALPILLPLFAILSQSQNPNWLLLAPLCGAGLIGILVGAVIGSVVQVFTSATWTLAYRELTGVAPMSRRPLPPEPLPPEPLPPAAEPPSPIGEG